MFTITRGQGFHITLSNGWTVSVQFGPINYCENKGLPISSPNREDYWRSNTAEIAAWPNESAVANGMAWFKFSNNDTVKGWCTPTEVLQFINHIAKLPPITTDYSKVDPNTGEITDERTEQETDE